MEGGSGEAWRARLTGAEIVAVFAAGTEVCRAPEPGRGEVARVLEVGDGEAGGVRMVAVWGGDDSTVRAARLVGEVDGWIEDARGGWGGDRPRSGAHPGLVESITDNLMWMVLLQPETGRLYVPAGRRWIFPKPPGLQTDDSGACRRRRSACAGTGTRRSQRVDDDWTVFGCGRGAADRDAEAGAGGAMRGVGPRGSYRSSTSLRPSSTRRMSFRGNLPGSLAQGIVRYHGVELRNIRNIRKLRACRNQPDHPTARGL